MSDKILDSWEKNGFTIKNSGKKDDNNKPMGLILNGDGDPSIFFKKFEKGVNTDTRRILEQYFLLHIQGKTVPESTPGFFLRSLSDPQARMEKSIQIPHTDAPFINKETGKNVQNICLSTGPRDSSPIPTVFASAVDWLWLISPHLQNKKAVRAVWNTINQKGQQDIEGVFKAIGEKMIKVHEQMLNNRNAFVAEWHPNTTVIFDATRTDILHCASMHTVNQNPRNGFMKVGFF